jgi:hypothetical protein
MQCSVVAGVGPMRQSRDLEFELGVTSDATNPASRTTLRRVASPRASLSPRHFFHTITISLYPEDGKFLRHTSAASSCSGPSNIVKASSTSTGQSTTAMGGEIVCDSQSSFNHDADEMNSRPKSLDDVAAQDHTVTILRRTLQSANLPHMLFYGYISLLSWPPSSC